MTKASLQLPEGGILERKLVRAPVRRPRPIRAATSREKADEAANVAGM